MGHQRTRKYRSRHRTGSQERTCRACWQGWRRVVDGAHCRTVPFNELRSPEQESKAAAAAELCCEKLQISGRIRISAGPSDLSMMLRDGLDPRKASRPTSTNRGVGRHE